MAEQAYFRKFKNFQPDPQATLIENWEHLVAWRGWKQDGKKYRKAKKDYMEALTEDYIESIEEGGAPEKLAGLQGLCGDLNVSPIPTSITQCRKELGRKHVCIIDLIDSRRRRTRVPTFRTSSALQEHISTEKHFFSKDDAKEKAGGILTVLLRTI